MTEQEKNKKLKTMYAGINDCWKLYKAFIGTENSEDGKWAEMLAEGARIKDKHKGIRGIEGMVVGIMEQLENEAMGDRKE